MSRRLPPLNPLKAFEAAARHRSLTLAADELHVTQVAISRQVRLLEDHLGEALFVRGHRSITLTPQGERLQRGIAPAFDQIESAIKAVATRNRRDVLSIQAYTTFAQRWLIPLMSRFHDEFPEIEVRLTTSTAPIDFERQSVDAAIRSGPGGWPGLEADFLAPLELMPVASPRLQQQTQPLAKPADLRRHTLLHSLARPDDWTSWLHAAGETRTDGYGGLKFESSALAFEAALQGMGVAIAPRVLVAQWLAEGVLVAPFDVTCRLASSYFLVRPAGRPASRALRLFRQYLLEELRRRGAA
ncbi:transcriptional regulator GcvA [Caballeronia sp. 15711]|uniref:transcriptional regulator GcvA n=1 Tax=Caballeronia sp. 15711 TaxID=3391029 RepID=UPI0039E44382